METKTWFNCPESFAVTTLSNGIDQDIEFWRIGGNGSSRYFKKDDGIEILLKGDNGAEWRENAKTAPIYKYMVIEFDNYPNNYFWCIRQSRITHEVTIKEFVTSLDPGGVKEWEEETQVNRPTHKGMGLVTNQQSWSKHMAY